MKKHLSIFLLLYCLSISAQQFAIKTSGNYIDQLSGYRFYTNVKIIDMDSFQLISNENANFKIYVEFYSTNKNQYNQLLGSGQLKIFKNNGYPTTYNINYGTMENNELIGDYFNLYNFETRKGNIARIQKTDGKSIFTIEDYYMRRTYIYE